MIEGSETTYRSNLKNYILDFVSYFCLFLED